MMMRKASFILAFFSLAMFRAGTPPTDLLFFTVCVSLEAVIVICYLTYYVHWYREYFHSGYQPGTGSYFFSLVPIIIFMFLLGLTYGTILVLIWVGGTIMLLMLRALPTLLEVREFVRNLHKVIGGVLEGAPGG